ncbi:glycogen operon protein GlgX homolog [Fulvitalea axinellae]|uniref:Glycogen operon protein GlgX homolog n=1 Tax=Fulvitalea axinellae TaxID=1182444 RepID=A0AAU9C8A8_9BACT|nr:glycogen operon protein GlgX homolog [Fulvitalea axinellae]
MGVRKKRKDISVVAGHCSPVGVTITKEGVNFCLFSKQATSVELLLFDKPEDAEPARTITFDPKRNRTYYYWHALVKGIGHGQLYAYRVNGPYAPKKGLRFDKDRYLVDPYARAVVGPDYDREKHKKRGWNGPWSLKSAVIDSSLYDWEDDEPPKIPYEESVIYEMHVKGFTMNPNSGVPEAERGTYSGVIRKIPYLKKLGVTAVELMPIHLFDPYDAPKGKVNYWGYSSINFFSPHNRYSKSPHEATAIVDEFRDMVKALHKAGIEVILDVVYNHTAEGDETGPVLSFKGLSNSGYYMLEDDDASKYKNFTGCGNTVNANQSIARRLILDSLCYWVKEMHVDGFRFDLASILSRSESGEPMDNPPILWEIESEPALAGTKIIAEAWDAAGLYQLGQFTGDRWAEWNGAFRDDVRRFIKGDTGSVAVFQRRLLGSPDIFRGKEWETTRSIHFVACHDGMPLYDLVSYNQKHNDANGEHNRDGMDDNFSWNCGEEGPTDNKKVLALRRKQLKNFLTLIFFSQGTPMLLMGDELGRTQQGNNNAYCQDNELSWMDWSLTKKNADLLAFSRNVIGFANRLKVMQVKHWLAESKMENDSCIVWHGVKLNSPDMSEHSHSIACGLHHPKSKERLYCAVNAYWEALDFEIPTDLKYNRKWRRVVNTALGKGLDFIDPDKAPIVPGNTIRVEARSIIVLMAKH